MGRNRSIDDLRSAHLYFAKASEAQIQSMPSYFGDQKSSLEAIFAEIEAASKDRLFIGIKKTGDFSRRREWTDAADEVLSRTKLYLRSTTPKNVREYFPESNGISSRQIDRLHAINKVLAVSEHFEDAHLGKFKTELEALIADAWDIFGAASVSATYQKAEVKKLNALITDWEKQYQKLKFLFRGYFYGTSTDWTMFFWERRLPKEVSIDRNEEETVSTEASSETTAA